MLCNSTIINNHNRFSHSTCELRNGNIVRTELFLNCKPGIGHDKKRNPKACISSFVLNFEHVLSNEITVYNIKYPEPYKNDCKIK